MNKTPQKSYPVLARKIDIAELWIKHEYLNESGSHKIRLIKYLIEREIQTGQKNFVISSSGNAAIAAAFYFNQKIKQNFKLQIFISKKISLEKNKRLQQAQNNNSNIVIKKVLRPKQNAFLFSKKNQACLLLGSKQKNSPQAYLSLAKEISKIPNLQAIFVPTSSGTTALGLSQGFKKFKKNIEIHIVQTEKIHSMAKKFDHNFSLKKTSLAQAIVDRSALRKKEVARAIKESLGSGWVISDNLLKKTKQILEKNTNLDSPSYDALLSLAGVIKAQKQGWPISKTICCLFTGL